MWLVPHVCSTHLCFPCVQCASAVQQKVLCVLCLQCALGALHEWFGQCKKQHPWVPLHRPRAALQPAPALPSMGVVMASCSCQGMKCIVGVPASLAAVQQDSACSPAGFSRVFFLCPSPPDSKALALCGLKLCQEWHNTPSCTQGQISVTARATHQTQPRGWRCRHGRLPSCKHLHSSRRDAEGAGTCPAVAPGAKSSALPPQGSTSANP